MPVRLRFAWFQKMIEGFNAYLVESMKGMMTRFFPYKPTGR
jgi:hypothetical protein